MLQSITINTHKFCWHNTKNPGDYKWPFIPQLHVTNNLWCSGRAKLTIRKRSGQQIARWMVSVTILSPFFWIMSHKQVAINKYKVNVSKHLINCWFTATETSGKFDQTYVDPYANTNKTQKHNHKNTTTPPQRHNHKKSQQRNHKNTTTPPQKHNHTTTKTQKHKHKDTTTKTRPYHHKKTQQHHHKNITTEPQPQGDAKPYERQPPLSAIANKRRQLPFQCSRTFVTSEGNDCEFNKKVPRA